MNFIIIFYHLFLFLFLEHPLLSLVTQTQSMERQPLT